MGKRIRVGTRESALAIAQSKLIINKLKAVNPDLEYELVGMKTKGDILLNTKLDLIGGKGLFVNEIEKALTEGTIDIAVHSMKDMPAVMPDELFIAAVSEREDPRDVLVTTDGRKLRDLKEGAVVGTSSIRREVQLLNLRPDLKIKQLRGNVLTRLDKLNAGEYDAIVLAAAGLTRLGLSKKCSQFFEADEMLPAIGQGILGVQIKKGSEVEELVSKINCRDSFLQLEAERIFMFRLNGGCSTPIAAFASLNGDVMKVTGMFVSPRSGKIYKALVEGNKYDARKLGEQLADIIIKESGGIDLGE